jgi:kynurenine 3-monooxygenase
VPTIATDGAGSAVRASLATAGLLAVREEWLDHDYKELTLPPAAAGTLERHALHIWPRGGFMLIALPNTDGSFTATLFLARTGPVSFAALASAEAVQQFFAREFADALPLLPDLPAQFAAHPQGQLGTIHAAPWHIAGALLLLGDAAHAIVPFHGQGMNAAFEDCAELDALLDGADSWSELFARFEQSRRENSAAIAQMALENYLEMRDTVLDAGFLRRKALAMALERRFPDRFIPRYSMVMFHPEIPYAEARRRGTLQEQLLQELDTAAAGVDSPLAERLVQARLPPLRAEPPGALRPTH